MINGIASISDTINEIDIIVAGSSECESSALSREAITELADTIDM